MWFWSRSQDICVTAWRAVQKFSRTMGLPIGDKAGGAHITAEDQPMTTINPKLPDGRTKWGMLYLNPESCRFDIDLEMVDGHIDQLKRQLQDKEASIFSWIQAWMHSLQPSLPITLVHPQIASASCMSTFKLFLMHNCAF
ncbi:hypothetical protein N7481_007108 [Penicillium waksmanii]|uniref:uncharacterized protein n=1 Tax=Penicillium waksmanii TaxID=69791 RepID=UPI002548B37A|nr:uncharacterized protein N7481_007108 [Penicillium waksmanii]KAJ5979810.1 hypothetical protein N7481_007108 [Penicillium waksmanii]